MPWQCHRSVNVCTQYEFSTALSHRKGRMDDRNIGEILVSDQKSYYQEEGVKGG